MLPPVPGRFTGGMWKLIGLLALVVLGCVLLGHVAKVVIGLALVALLVIIARAVYQTVTSARAGT